MATRKGINIYETYVAYHKLYAFFIYYLVLCTLYSKKLKGRTEAYSYCLLNSTTIRAHHPTRCFNFGLLRRIHPNGCKFDLFFIF